MNNYLVMVTKADNLTVLSPQTLEPTSDKLHKYPNLYLLFYFR